MQPTTGKRREKLSCVLPASTGSLVERITFTGSRWDDTAALSHSQPGRLPCPHLAPSPNEILTIPSLQSGCTSIDSIDDAKGYQQLRDAFRDMSFSDHQVRLSLLLQSVCCSNPTIVRHASHQVHELLSCVAAVLHLSLVAFTDTDDGGSAVAPDPACGAALVTAARLLGVAHPEDLALVLTSQRSAGCQCLPR